MHIDHSQEYKRGQLVQAASAFITTGRPCLEAEFRRQASNLLPFGLRESLGKVPLTQVAQLIIFAAEGYLPE